MHPFGKPRFPEPEVLAPLTIFHKCSGIFVESNSMADMGAHEVVVAEPLGIGVVDTLKINEVCGCSIPAGMHVRKESLAAVVRRWPARMSSSHSEYLVLRDW